MLWKTYLITIYFTYVWTFPLIGVSGDYEIISRIFQDRDEDPGTEFDSSVSMKMAARPRRTSYAGFEGNRINDEDKKRFRSFQKDNRNGKKATGPDPKSTEMLQTIIPLINETDEVLQNNKDDCSNVDRSYVTTEDLEKDNSAILDYKPDSLVNTNKSRRTVHKSDDQKFDGPKSIGLLPLSELMHFIFSNRPERPHEGYHPWEILKFWSYLPFDTLQHEPGYFLQ